MRFLQRVGLLHIAVGVEQHGADVGVEAGLDQSRWGARVAASWGSEDAGVCVQELVVGDCDAGTLGPGDQGHHEELAERLRYA
jgi:hypothetical protein